MPQESRYVKGKTQNCIQHDKFLAVVTGHTSKFVKYPVPPFTVRATPISSPKGDPCVVDGF